MAAKPFGGRGCFDCCWRGPQSTRRLEAGLFSVRRVVQRKNESLRRAVSNVAELVNKFEPRVKIVLRRIVPVRVADGCTWDSDDGYGVLCRFGPRIDGVDGNLGRGEAHLGTARNKSFRMS